eukprot:6375107-Pyramimonas_sp.AAC.1
MKLALPGHQAARAVSAPRLRFCYFWRSRTSSVEDGFEGHRGALHPGHLGGQRHGRRGLGAARCGDRTELEGLLPAPAKLHRRAQGGIPSLS